MPLKILKRTSKQYNVVSKSTFVISVELLDSGIMECTLDADSTGRDCLLNISQRLGLHQVFFQYTVLRICRVLLDNIDLEQVT